MKFIWALLLLAAVCLAGDDDPLCGGSSCYYKIEGTKLTLWSEYRADSYDMCSQLPPWWNQKDSITEVEVKNDGGDYFDNVRDCTFKGLTKLTTATISAKHIHDYVFEGCSELTTVTFTDIEDLGSQVFKDCPKLKTVTIPTSCDSIREDAFMYSSLESIVVADGHEDFSAENGVLFDKDKTELIAYPPAKADTAYVIPESVTSFGQFAFNDCNNLQTVTLPKDLTTYNWQPSAFVRMAGLKTFALAEGQDNYAVDGGVLFNAAKTTLYRYPQAKENAAQTYEIPESVQTVYSYAFEGCSALTSITLSKNTYSFEETALDGCRGLTTIAVAADNSYFVAHENALIKKYTPGSSTLVKVAAKITATKYAFAAPEGVTITSVAAKAFEGCTSLTEIDAPAAVTTIGNQAFLDCTGLSKFNIRKELTSLQENAFDGCTGLTEFTVEAGEQQSYKVDTGCLVTGSRIVKYPAKSEAADFSIPTAEENALSEIGVRAFEGCANLQSLTIPATITTVRPYAFLNSAKLSKVTYLGDSRVSTDGNVRAFEGCPVTRACVSDEYLTTYKEQQGFCGLPASDCAPEPPAPTPKSSSAAAVVPTLFAVVAAVLAIFF